MKPANEKLTKRFLSFRMCVVFLFACSASRMSSQQYFDSIVNVMFHSKHDTIIVFKRIQAYGKKSDLFTIQKLRFAENIDSLTHIAKTDTCSAVNYPSNFSKSKLLGYEQGQNLSSLVMNNAYTKDEKHNTKKYEIISRYKIVEQRELQGQVIFSSTHDKQIQTNSTVTPKTNLADEYKAAASVAWKSPYTGAAYALFEYYESICDEHGNTFKIARIQEKCVNLLGAR